MQPSYNNAVIEIFKNDNCKPAATTLLPGLDLNRASAILIIDQTTLGQLIRKLIDLANTVRLYISFATNFMGSFMHEQTNEMLHAGKHVLRYIKRTVCKTSCQHGPKALNL